MVIRFPETFDIAGVMLSVGSFRDSRVSDLKIGVEQLSFILDGKLFSLGKIE